LKQNTNEVLERYLDRLRSEGYYEKGANMSYGIEFTATDTSPLKYPAIQFW